MFADACKVASQFTRPVIVSTRKLDGSVKSVCGACIVLNKDGWAMTAGHVFNSSLAAQEHNPHVEKYKAEVSAIEADATLNPRQKAKKIRRVKNNPEWITNLSIWWGRDGVTMPEVAIQGEIDLAVGQLKPWNAAWVSDYPTFKDPTKAMQPGRSLCRIGYPFLEIGCTFDEAKNGFTLEKGSVPPPLFALEGIFSRIAVFGRSKDNRYEIKVLETSSPGLMGQSGGPIFDTKGTVWALQSRTHHFPLGFSPKVRRRGREIEEHQFLNVGRGVHSEVIIAFLRDNDIEFQLSDY